MGDLQVTAMWVAIRSLGKTCVVVIGHYAARISDRPQVTIYCKRNSSKKSSFLQDFYWLNLGRNEIFQIPAMVDIG